MIYMKSTNNHYGVTLYGDYRDFQELYEALHDIVGEEDEFFDYEGPRLRVLGLCYDIRHALMGDREFELVNNVGFEDLNYNAIIRYDKSIYLKFNILWPEMIFIGIVLNDFILLRTVQNHYYEWHKTIATVRKLQAALTNCLEETVSKTAFKQIMKNMQVDYKQFSSYITQYVDIINHRFMQMSNLQRPKKLAAISNSLVTPNQEYNEIKKQVLDVVRKNNCHITDVNPQLDYPNDIDW